MRPPVLPHFPDFQNIIRGQFARINSFTTSMAFWIFSKWMKFTSKNTVWFCDRPMTNTPCLPSFFHHVLDVVFIRPKKKMPDVHAFSVIAMMQDMKMAGIGYANRPHHTMRTTAKTCSSSISPIPIRIKTANPLFALPKIFTFQTYNVRTGWIGDFGKKRIMSDVFNHPSVVTLHY